MFVNGVSVVTTLVGGVPYGMSIAWATQVEAEHLIVSLPRDSVATKRLLTAGCFTVNILAASQKDLAVRFGSSERPENKFDGVDYAVKGNAVIIANCCRALFCELESTREIGGQLVVMGWVGTRTWFPATPRRSSTKSVTIFPGSERKRIAKGASSPPNCKAANGLCTGSC